MNLSGQDLSSIWYQHDSDGTISYTDIGRTTYAEIFRQVGVDIDDVSTIEQHRETVLLAVGKRVDLKEPGRLLSWRRLLVLNDT